MSKLPNFNVDTIAAFLEGALTRLENLEAVVAPLLSFVPSAEPFVAAGEGATGAAGAVVRDVQTGLDAITGQTAPPAPKPAPAAPRPAQAPQPAAGSPAAIIAQKAGAANGAA